MLVTDKIGGMQCIITKWKNNVTSSLVHKVTNMVEKVYTLVNRYVRWVFVLDFVVI